MRIFNSQLLAIGGIALLAGAFLFLKIVSAITGVDVTIFEIYK